MSRLRYPSQTPRKKTQVSIFFIALISILLIITMVTINIGKIAVDKTYTANSADAGALAAASVMAYAFNYVAEANKAKKDKRFEGNWQRFDQAVTKYVTNTSKLYQEYVKLSSEVQAKTCCLPICGAAPKAMEAYRKIGTKGAGGGKGTGFIGQVYDMIKGAMENDKADGKEDQKGNELGLIPNYWKLQEDFYIKLREIVHDDQAGQNDLYQNALSAGYRFNLYNSGFFKKMGEDSKEFSEFVSSLTPQNVSNCQEETFTWTDKAGRSHTVSAVVCIGAVHDYTLIETVENRQTIKGHLDRAMELAEEAKRTILDNAVPEYKAACGCIPCEPCASFCICIPDCYGHDANGDAFMREADQAMYEAMGEVLDARAGLRKGNSKGSNEKTSTKDDIICYIDDIQHDRRTSSMQFQKHQGGVVKSPRLEIDTPTFYPPMQSSSSASFQGQGSIQNKQPSHDASLNTGG